MLMTICASSLVTLYTCNHIVISFIYISIHRISNSYYVLAGQITMCQTDNQQSMQITNRNPRIHITRAVAGSMATVLITTRASGSRCFPEDPSRPGEPGAPGAGE